MRTSIIALALVLAAAGSLTACNRAKTDAQVAQDTNAAQEKAADKVTKADQNAAEKEADARKDVRSEQRDYEHVAAVQNQKVAETEAEGAHKVALAQCEALSGTAQKSCRDQADANYEVAQAKAKQARAASDPKP
jgi:Na+-translocating ferredoxin:NAD+ oxidoreductase RnfG subunit